MDLLERYLQAIRRNLPADRAADVSAELRDDLLSRTEEREAGLGRSLREDELAALIKESGHPLLVAGRYRSRQSLIGPETYPFFLFTLRIVLLIVAAIVLVVAVGSVAIAGIDPLAAFANAVGQMFMYGLINLGIVTFVFAMLERSGFPADYLGKWRPEQLPDPGDAQPGPWKSAMEVALSVAFLLWWTGAIRLQIPAGSQFQLALAPIWSQLYWPITALLAARLVHNVVQWLRPRWTTVRAILGAATALAGIVLLPIIYAAGEWARVIPTGMSVGEASQLQDSLNLALRIAIVVVAIIWLLNCVGELWRLARRWREGPDALRTRSAAP